MARLYLDEDVHKKIALDLRLRGYDAISAHEVNNQGISDYTQLEYAVSEQRAIFTLQYWRFSKIAQRVCRIRKRTFWHTPVKTDTFPRNPESPDKVFVRSHGQQTEK